MPRYRVHNVFSDTRRRLITLESVAMDHTKFNGFCWLYGQIETLAIIILDGDSSSAFSVEAKPVSLELLRRDVPELDRMIQELTTLDTTDVAI